MANVENAEYYKNETAYIGYLISRIKKYDPNLYELTDQELDSLQERIDDIRSSIKLIEETIKLIVSMQNASVICKEDKQF